MSAVSLPLSVAGVAAATTAAPAPPVMADAPVPEGAAEATPASAIEGAGVDLPASAIDPDNAATTAQATETASVAGTVASAAPVTAAEAFAARGQATTAASPAPIATTTAHTGVATPAPAPASTAGSLGGAVFALVLVVGLILLLGWLAKRMPGLGGTRNNAALRVVGSLALGPRDRVVVVAVGDTQLLLGVGSGGTRTLHTLAEPLPVAPESKATPAFAQLLAQHFGKKP